jgi:hypothetical protein
MLGLNSLGALLADAELRRLLAGVASQKIKADLKTIEAHAELSRRLAEARRSPSGEGAALRQVVKEHLEYYATLLSLSHSFHQRLLDLLAETAPGRAAEPAVNGLTMALRAPMGATVRAPFKITNNRGEPITVTCRATPFVSEDGTQMVASRLAFLPPGADIAPGSEEVFEVVLPVGPDFVPGRTYLATLAADGFEATDIVVRLSVEAARPEAPVEALEPTEPRDAPRPKRTSARTAGGSRKRVAKVGAP